jgi:two-component system, LytTR family, response regulator
MLRCLLVDDEPLALRLLAGYVERIPFLELVGTCRSAIEAMQVLQRESVDVLFLDVQMPDLTGVDFVRTLRPNAAVVFTTAYKQYAVEGFDLDAVDYLIKPIPFDRFLKAATKVQERLQPAAPPAAGAAPAAPAPAAAEEFIFVKADYHTQRVTLRDIRYLEGLKDYVKIHTGAGKPLLTLNSLRAFEERLPATEFVRVHRSYIVALNWIDSIRKNRIYLAGDVVIPVGDAYAEAFHQLIEQRNMH